MTRGSCSDAIAALETSGARLSTPRGRVLLTGTWLSPNDVTHTIVRGSCVTCGRSHPTEEIR